MLPVAISKPIRMMVAWRRVMTSLGVEVFVKDQDAMVADNVTFFFNFEVVECYDCFYLNSFITDTKFTFKRGGPSVLRGQ